MENHYNTLNVQFGDSAETIKTAYRRLAMRWHPDKNLYNPLAENKFKIILRAYQVLSGPDRKNYDVEYARVFKKHPHQQPFQHTNFNKQAPGTYDEHGNVYDDINKPNHHSFTSHKHIRVKVSLDFWDGILGCTKSYQIKDPFTQILMSVEVKFPPGISENEVCQITSHLRIIEFHVSLLTDEYFTRKDLDIFSYFDIPFSIATSGGTVNYPYWSGNIMLQIPMGFQHGQNIKLEGKGIQKNGKKGDLYLKGKIIVPMNITLSQKELIHKFQKIEDDKGKPSPLFKFLHELWKKK